MATAFNFATKQAALSGAALDVPSFWDEIKAAQATAEGILYPPIGSAAGKFELGGRLSGLLVRLDSAWQAFFAPGSYQATVDGGVLVGGLGGQPIAYSAGVQVLLNRPADAFVVSGSGGDGVVNTEDLVAALQAAVIPVNLKKINDVSIYGTGSNADPWREVQ